MVACLVLPGDHGLQKTLPTTEASIIADAQLIHMKASACEGSSHNIHDDPIASTHNPNER